jgi:hypothetical protein
MLLLAKTKSMRKDIMNSAMEMMDAAGFKNIQDTTAQKYI